MEPAAQCRFNDTWMALQYESHLIPPSDEEQRGVAVWTNYLRALDWALPTLLVVRLVWLYVRARTPG